MNVFVVTESDYDNTWIIAVYPTLEMAKEHERLMGGYVEECAVLDILHPDVTGPLHFTAPPLRGSVGGGK